MNYYLLAFIDFHSPIRKGRSNKNEVNLKKKDKLEVRKLCQFLHFLCFSSATEHSDELETMCMTPWCRSN